MLRNRTCKFLSKACGCKTSVRGSALFISSAKATETFAYVTPHIDFPEQLKQRELIIEELARRNYEINLGKIENLWTVYEKLKLCKEEYDKNKEELSGKLGKIIKNNPESEEVKKYKLQIELIKDNLRKLKAPLWSAEENAVVEVLKLPNTLHKLTPDGETKVLYTYLDPPENYKNHLQIGKDLNILHFKKNENYYLKGDAAIFELGVKFHISKLLKQNECIQFSNPDFVKSVIIEGCGEDHTNPDSTFILHHNEDSKVNANNRLHLTGGGSLYSFFAYLSKNVIPPKAFPLKYFSLGRQYTPSPSEEDSLFHISQSSAVQFYGATKKSADLDILLEEIIDLYKSIYTGMGYHYRIRLVPAKKLLKWESLRVTIEMYSTSLNSYIEVGNISLCGDYISKRLMLTYVENKQNCFPFVMSGTVLNVPKFLGCVLEQDTEFTVPDSFKVENWSLN